MQDPRGKAEGGSQEQQSADPPQGDEKEAKKQRIEQSTVMPGEIAVTASPAHSYQTILGPA